LSQRLAVRSNSNYVWLPFGPPKLFVSASVFAAKLCGKLCDPRPRFLATSSRHAGDVQRRQQARNALQPFYCKELAAYRLKGLSGPNGRPTFVAIAANLPGKAHWPRPNVAPQKPNWRTAATRPLVRSGTPIPTSNWRSAAWTSRQRSSRLRSGRMSPRWPPISSVSAR